MLVPFGAGSQEESVESIVKREIRRDRRKRERDDDDAKLIQTFSNLNTMQVISTAQQALVTHLQSPPLDPLGQPVVSLATPPSFGDKEKAVLKWASNGVLLLLQNQYNVISALRAESMMGFLVNGLSTNHKSGGLFGGGLVNLMVLSSVTGGGFGLTNLFGGGGTNVLTGLTSRWLT